MNTTLRRHLLPLFLSFLVQTAGMCQPAAVLKTATGVHSEELQRILYFEGINYQTFSLRAPKLAGKNFFIVMKEYKAGLGTRIDTVFDSRESDYFRIKSDSLNFSVLAKAGETGVFKIEFQFNGFSAGRRYPISVKDAEKFTLKSFYGPGGGRVSLDTANYLLAFMTPYVRPDKSEAYCEVAQSGTDPEKLYQRYRIPHYFLLQIGFR